MEKINQPLRVNEQTVRGIAFQVFTLSVITVLSGFSGIYEKFPQPVIAVPVAITAFLFMDFLIRAIAPSRYSLLAFASKRLNRYIFRFPVRMILLRPKKFAAGIGAVLSGCSLAAVYLDYIPVMQILMSLLAVFSFLEGALGFCAGCRIFALLIKAGLFREELCEDCVLPGGGGI
jgi:hypothetical protein